MRKTVKRKVMLAAVSCLALACVSIVGVTANAADEPENGGKFYAQAGASVLLSKTTLENQDTNGIRFTYMMSKTQYENNVSEVEGVKTWNSGVSVTAYIVPTHLSTENAQVIATDADSESEAIPADKWIWRAADNAYVSYAYMWNIDDGVYDWSLSSTAKMVTASETLYTTVQTRSMAQVAYEALQDPTLYPVGSADYNTLRGYLPEYTVTYTNDGATYTTETVKYGDTVQGVTDPTKAGGYKFDEWQLNDAAYDTSAGVFGDTALTASYIAPTVLQAYDYSLGNSSYPMATIDLAEVNATNGITIGAVTAVKHTDDTAIATSTAEDVITVTADSQNVLTADYATATGATTNVVLYTENTNYVLPLNVYSMAIRTAEEFYNLRTYLDANEQIVGHYVLVNDIDYSTYNGGVFPKMNRELTVSAATTKGWCGVFDGQDHVIENVTVVSNGTSSCWSAGIFGAICSNGTVKNVAVKNSKVASGVTGYGAAYGGVFAHAIFGTVENVYVSGTAATGYNNGPSALLAQIIYNGASVKNVTVVPTSTLSYFNYALCGKVNNNSINTQIGTIENAVVLNAPENKLAGGYATAAAVQTKNATIQAYADSSDAADAIANQALTANGSASFEANGPKVTVKWNGKVMNEVATAYDYSLGKKTIDFSLVGGVSAADITGITNANGNALEYTTSGDVVTITSDPDAVLTAKAQTATGAQTSITVTTANGACTIPLNVYSLAIRTVDDFNSLNTYVDINTDYNSDGVADLSVKGYYVLCNDLDFEGGEFEVFCSTAELGSGGYKGWCATFDGRNHVISNMKLVQNYWHYINRLEANKIADDDARKAQAGVFGSIGFAGCVKNVAFVSCENATKGGFLADYIYGGSSSTAGVENVFISATQTSDTASLLAKNVTVNYAGIFDVVTVALGNDFAGYSMVQNTNSDYKGLSSFRRSCYSIGVAGDKVAAGATFTDGTKASNITNWSTAAATTATGSTTSEKWFRVIADNGDMAIYWQGYETTLYYYTAA
ncbi:MAG: InlB B-repeat-containing protein [Clostridia bacterium]|nr:InlB B-repeat-containing protein [Clostridia bacterium]